MQNPFFEKPILNSPYAYPQRHWELDEQGQPTQRIIDNRRKAEFISQIEAVAKEHTAAASLWLSGLEAVQRKLGLARVFDLSAMPFFLSGSGYAEGTLFPWTMPGPCLDHE